MRGSISCRARIAWRFCREIRVMRSPSGGAPMPSSASIRERWIKPMNFTSRKGRLPVVHATAWMWMNVRGNREAKKISAAQSATQKNSMPTSCMVPWGPSSVWGATQTERLHLVQDTHWPSRNPPCAIAAIGTWRRQPATPMSMGSLVLDNALCATILTDHLTNSSSISPAVNCAVAATAISPAAWRWNPPVFMPSSDQVNAPRATPRTLRKTDSV